jgi:hypothetical protein
MGLAAMTGIFLSLGPYAQLSHTLAIGKGIKLPLYYLYRLSASFGIFKCPGRMHVIVFYVALICSGHVLNSLRLILAKKNHLRSKALWPILMGSFILLNVAWTGRLGKGFLFPTPKVPEFYQSLGNRPGNGAVMDVPIDYYVTAMYNYYQFWHKRPNVSSVLYHDGLRAKSMQFLKSDERFRFFFIENRSSASPRILKKIEEPDFMNKLAQSGIDYFIIHPRFIKAYKDRRDMVPQTLEYYGQLDKFWKDRCVYKDDLIWVYRTMDR